MFSILIPTWNNLAFAQCCYNSIVKNSVEKHQIIFHINDGSDGTLAWVQENNIAYTHSAENIGVCKALNQASTLATQMYIVYMNDDMYCLPNWDKYLIEELAKINTDLFMLSSTMIEPTNTNNACVIVANYGTWPLDFKEEKINADYKNYSKNNWQGAFWPPNVVSKKAWDKVGGFSEAFSPGMSSDDDFAMKLWQSGCRIFKGVGASRVYHFQSKSTGRVVKNDGRKQFLQKWKITQGAFRKYYLRLGKPYQKDFEKEEKSLAFYMAKIKSKLKLLKG